MVEQAPTTDTLQNSSNPETLDRVVSTTTPRLWLAFVGMVLLIGAIAVWAFVSRIPVSVQNYGVVTVPGSYAVVPAVADGYVTLGGLQLDDRVKAGDRIATLTPFDGSEPVDLNAPIDGVLSSITVANGSGVTAGVNVAAVTGETAAGDVDIVAYVDPISLPTYTRGQTVEVQLAIDSETAPTIAGVVESVARVPTSLGNLEAQQVPSAAIFDLSKQAGGLLYPIVIRLTGAGKDVPVEAGQVVTVINTYATVRPVNALLSGTQ